MNKYIYSGVVLDVYDGDTVTIDVDLGFKIHFTERFRLFGLNAPEIKGKERPEGLVSATALREWCEGKEILIETIKDKKGKYGRYLAILWLNGVNLNERLLAEGLAKPAIY